MNSPELLVCQLGVVEYREALALQERVRAARQAERIPDTLLLLEHWPVYTRGRRSDSSELPMGEDWYLQQGIDVVDTDRGGRVTYHAPGQLVGYPIMRVDDVIAYLRTMETALVVALADVGIRARPRTDEGPDFTGVWAGDRKIASIGVHVSRAIATHGFAVNVQNDLQPFEWVIPCGLHDISMTSVLKQTNGSGELLRGFREIAARRFAEAFGRRPRLIAGEELESQIGPVPAGS